jgi:hypothetical protein
MMHATQYRLSTLLCTCLLTISAFRAAASPNVEARVYNPSCPVYFSVALADIRFTYFLSPDLDPSTVASSTVVYSFRNDWTRTSWFRTPASIMAKPGNQWGLYQADVEGIEVANRGSYTFSHVEFAIKWTFKDGYEQWDNGGQSPLSFYSARLPELQCYARELWYLNVSAFADAKQYE